MPTLEMVYFRIFGAFASNYSIFCISLDLMMIRGNTRSSCCPCSDQDQTYEVSDQCNARTTKSLKVLRSMKRICPGKQALNKKVLQRGKILRKLKKEIDLENFVLAFIQWIAVQPDSRFLFEWVTFRKVF